MSTRRSKRKSSAAATAAISEQAPGTNSSATGNGSSTSSTRTTPARSKAKTPRPMKEMLGKRISVIWPRDKSSYPARVIDFDEKKKLHTVIYDEDNSIEVLNLSRRKYTNLDPTGDETDEKCLIGKKIILVVPVSDEDNSDAPKDDYTCIILRKSVSEDDEDDDDEEEDNEVENDEGDEDKVALVDVIYLSNEYITTVDLSKHQFTILDMQTNEKVKEITEGEGSLFVDLGFATGEKKPAEEPAGIEDKPASVEEKKDETEPKSQPATEETPIELPTDAPASTPVDKVELEKPAAPENPAVPVASTGANGTGDDDALLDDEPPLAPEVPAQPEVSDKATPVVAVDKQAKDVEMAENASTGNPTVEAVTPVKATPVKDAVVVNPSNGDSTCGDVKAANNAPAPTPREGKTDEVMEVKQVEDKPKETKSDEPQAMDVVPATPVETAKPVEKKPTPADFSPIVPPPRRPAVDGNTKDEPKKDEPKEESKTTVASAATNEPSVDVRKLVKPLAEVVNPEVNAAQRHQPLTAENLSALEGATGNGVPAVDEDVKTLSDGDNEQWIATSSNRLSDPKSVEKKFVGIKVSEDKERIAFVEAHLSSGNHFIEFHDKEGGSMQLVLTTDNCRLLTDDEVDKLGGKRPVPPGGIQPPTSNKRKSANGKDGNANKRRRSNNSVQPVVPPVTKLPTLPPPGSEIVGKVITIQWPGNNDLYKGLVIGCQFGPEKTLHKIFYVEDESMETMDLSKRSWAHGNSSEIPWNMSGLVGKRLYVYWDGEYTEDDVQKKAEEKFGTKKTKVPYEAFVVKFLGPHKYRLLYTLDDNLEDRNLNDDDADWNVIESDAMDVDGLPIVSWTGPLEEEEEAAVAPE